MVNLAHFIASSLNDQIGRQLLMAFMASTSAIPPELHGCYNHILEALYSVGQAICATFSQVCSSLIVPGSASNIYLAESSINGVLSSPLNGKNSWLSPFLTLPTKARILCLDSL
jgi:hypothetical protein